MGVVKVMEAESREVVARDGAGAGAGRSGKGELLSDERSYGGGRGHHRDVAMAVPHHKCL